MKAPFLEGKAVYLRGLELADVNGGYADWLNDQEVCRGNSHARFPKSRGMLEEYVRRTVSSDSELVLAIILREGNKHIGNISLQLISWIDRSAEYAILIGDKSVWGKGYALEASELLLSHGFERLNLHRIWCCTLATNQSMRRLAQKLGMSEEGVHRDAMFKDGKYVDIIDFAVLRSEFEDRTFDGPDLPNNPIDGTPRN